MNENTSSTSQQVRRLPTWVRPFLLVGAALHFGFVLLRVHGLVFVGAFNPILVLITIGILVVTTICMAANVLVWLHTRARG